MDSSHEEEAYEGQEIELPQSFLPQSLLEQLSSFIANHEIVLGLNQRETHMDLTTDLLDQLYSEIGNEELSATHVISYIQRRHKWDIELLAERQDIDEMLYREYDTFDEHMWEKVLNTEAISDLHSEVYKLSQIYILKAIKEVFKRDNKTHP